MYNGRCKPYNTFRKGLLETYFQKWKEKYGEKLARLGFSQISVIPYEKIRSEELGMAEGAQQNKEAPQYPFIYII